MPIEQLFRTPQEAIEYLKANYHREVKQNDVGNWIAMISGDPWNLGDDEDLIQWANAMAVPLNWDEEE